MAVLEKKKNKTVRNNNTLCLNYKQLIKKLRSATSLFRRGRHSGQLCMFDLADFFMLDTLSDATPMGFVGCCWRDYFGPKVMEGLKSMPKVMLVAWLKSK